MLLDTDAFSALFVSGEQTARKQGHPIDDWRAALQGMAIVISFQTRAEVLAGAISARWEERKLSAVRGELDRTATVQLDQEVFDAYVALTVSCRAVGAALGQKVHTADRWVAASAVAKDLPILARDSVYQNAPGVRLLDIRDV